MNYQEQVKADRRAAAAERAALRNQGLNDGYSVAKAPEKTELPKLFTEASSYSVTKLGGGLKASLRAEKAAATRRRNKYAR
jgi:hypothetical protein